VELTMRNMSFALTTPEVLARVKTVTRRDGWTYLKSGERLQAIEKSQGLKKGEHVRRLAVLRVVDVRFEPLHRLLDEPDYGWREVEREGFRVPMSLYRTPERWVEWFITLFVATHDGVTLRTPLTRIAFEYEAVVDG
jgi:hypothetical protein